MEMVALDSEVEMAQARDLGSAWATETETPTAWEYPCG